MPAANTARPAISVSEAEHIITEQVSAVSTESRPLSDCAGSVLREPVVADRDFPPFDRVTMDGIALAASSFSAGRREYPILGLQAAGAPMTTLSEIDGCIEIMTGAVLPGGCDSVIPVEEIDVVEGVAHIQPGSAVFPGQFVHRRGSDHRQGEPLLEEGTLLHSPEIAVCATVGKSSLTVSRRFAVAVITTGDELVPVDRVPNDYQIRMSNSYAIEAALERSGRARVERFHAIDDHDALGEVIGAALEEADVVVLSGGVSAGKFDLVPEVLREQGVEILFHRVAQRPGFPLLFGATAAGKRVFALPGNPVSALVSTHRYLLPFLDRCSGVHPRPAETVLLNEEYRFEPPLTLFLPVALSAGPDGEPHAAPRPVNSSGDLGGLLGTDGFIELDRDQGVFDAGSRWPFYRWE